MPIHCPKCGKKYDVIQFEGDRPLRCGCGLMLDTSLFETIDDFTRYFENEEERQKAQVILEDANHICRMILDEGCQKVDIEIAQERLKEKVAELFPDKMNVYQMIYEARFKRLWEQFREKQ